MSQQDKEEVGRKIRTEFVNDGRMKRLLPSLGEVRAYIAGEGEESQITVSASIESPAGKQLIAVLVMVAERELDLIQERTKDRLARAKAQGKRLGRPSEPEMTEKIPAISRARNEPSRDRGASRLKSSICHAAPSPQQGIKSGRKSRMSPTEKPHDAQDGASKPSDNITIADANTYIGREEGNNSRPGYEYGTQDLGSSGDNPLGTGERSAESLPVSPGVVEDVEMKLAEIQVRFNDSAKIALRPRTRDAYFRSFKRMWQYCQFEGWTVAQLKSDKAKQLIINFIHEKIPERSRKSVLSGLEAVWIRTIYRGWPIENKLDIGKLPKVGKGACPRDATVKEWHEAMKLEKDPYDKLIWKFAAQLGLRPSHATGLKWSDLKEDEEGHIFAIVAIGDDKRFKSNAPVYAHLPPDMVVALDELKNELNPSEDAWILPNRGIKLKKIVYKGGKGANGRMSSPQYSNHWHKLMDRFKLPNLTPKGMRHWVDTALKNAEQGTPPLMTNSRAKMMGHDYADIEVKDPMGAVYYSNDWEPVVENQKLAIPYGPLARFEKMTVEVDDEMPLEIKKAWMDYRAGKIRLGMVQDIFEEAKMREESKMPRLETAKV